MARLDLKRYGVSVLLVLTATVLTLAVRPYFDGKTPLFFFTIAVILSSAYGGIRTGLLAVALSLGIAFSLFQNHVLVLAMSHSSLTLFAVIGVAVSVVIGKLGGLNAALVQTRDQLKIANKELELANEKLLQQTETLFHSNEELQRFAYALAHDLRNPLRTVGALTDLLIERNTEKLDEKSKECGRLIVNGVQRLESMVKSLLDYTAAVGSHEDHAITDCNTVLERVLLDLQHVIETSGALVKIDPLPPVQVSESHLVQVFLNLIGNAVKYRSVQKPQIHVWVKDNGTNWIFAVRDNGIGLDMKYADYIFGMFKRLDSSDRLEGNGIGLALCRAVIQGYGGQIWVESQSGKGSTFFFTLPKVAMGGLDVIHKPVGNEELPLKAKRASQNDQ